VGKPGQSHHAKFGEKGEKKLKKEKRKKMGL
jgi:hypothetical protein